VLSPCLITGVILIVEDKDGRAISLALFNQLNIETSWEELINEFPVGIEIGVKQPFMELSYSGILSLRNDNPENLIIRHDSYNKNENVEFHQR
jgi:hypothetical protein